MKQFNSILVASYLVAIAAEKGIPMNVTKAQKILFVLYAYYITIGRVIFDEQPKAWPFGPVFPKTRKKVDYNNAKPINSPEFDEIKSDVEFNESCISAVSNLGKNTASQLTEWSHKEGSPWDRTTKQVGFKSGAPIPDEFIKEYFATLFNNDTTPKKAVT